MTQRSNIEWTAQTWNPLAGCSVYSPGCAHCYAMRMAARIEAANRVNNASGFAVASQYDGTTKRVNGQAVWTGKINLAPDATLLAPLRRKTSTTYFVNSMSDLFHEAVPDEWIDRIFAVMALCPQHTFQVLTKRADRMQDYVSKIATDRSEYLTWRVGCSFILRDLNRENEATGPGPIWPLPNVWLGVSAERQKEADERIPHLLATPAAVRFLSAEPLLGPIDLTNHCNGHYFFDTLRGMRWHDDPEFVHKAEKFLPGLDWVIAGGESGPGARPMHPDWARALRDQCAEADVPFFFKQWGEWWEVDSDARDENGEHVLVDELMLAEGFDKKRDCMISSDGEVFRDWAKTPEGVRCRWMTRLGKKAAGRLLDGREHDAMPGAL